MMNEIVRVVCGILACITVILIGVNLKIYRETIQRERQVVPLKIQVLEYLKDLLVTTKLESFLLMENKGPDLRNFTYKIENISYFEQGEYLLNTGGNNEQI